MADNTHELKEEIGRLQLAAAASCVTEESLEVSIADMAEELQALRAIINKLPVNEGEDPVIPGDTMWRWRAFIGPIDNGDDDDGGKWEEVTIHTTSRRCCLVNIGDDWDSINNEDLFTEPMEAYCDPNE